MPKRSKRRRTLYTIDVDSPTMALLSQLSAESRIPIPQLITMSVRLFRIASKDLKNVHPPPTTAQPLNRDQRTNHVRQHYDRRQKPKSVGEILASIAETERNNPS